MNITPDSPTQPVENRLTLSPEEIDNLLFRVKNELRGDVFDRGDSQLIQQMIECLGDTRGMNRLGFAEALSVVGEPAVLPLMEALESHPNVVVQRAAAKTLTLIEDPRSIPLLLESFLHDPDQVVRNSCVGGLARMGSQVVPDLLEVIGSKDNDETIKGHAAWAIAFIGIQAKEQIYAAYNSESEDVRSAVVGAVLKIAEETPEDKAFEILLDALQDKSVSVRSEGAAALGNLAYKPATNPLIDLLENSEPESRKSAALALMKTKEPVAIANLQKALQEEAEASVQQVIKLAINQLQQQQQEDVDDDWEI